MWSLIIACNILVLVGAQFSHNFNLEQIEKKLELHSALINRLSEENKELKANVEKLTTKNMELETGLTNRLSRQDNAIGFTLAMTRDEIIEGNQRFMYHYVVSAIGTGLNAQTSQFFCPTTGHYVFSATSTSGQLQNQRSDLRIYVGGQSEGAIFVEGEGGRHHSSSVTVVVSCQAAMMAEVRCRPTITCHLASTNEDYTNTFSGFFLG